MYNVVRMLLQSRKCDVCGKTGSGHSLPSLTYLKGRIKSTIRTWYAKHELINVFVHQTKAGAKTGLDKYSSNFTAPMIIVKPTEWARRDFYTRTIRKLIWDKPLKTNRVFSSIETTPIVRNRDIHFSEIRMPGKDGLDRCLKEGSVLELRVVSNDHVENLLKKIDFEELRYEEDNLIRTAVITTSVFATQYISCDKIGHKVLEKDGKEFHESGSEKAGDVIIHLYCSGWKCRLVNRHNRGIGEHSVFLSFCIETSNGCKVRKVPIDRVMCLDEENVEESYSPNTGYLENGTKYFVYRFLLYTDGFSAHRSRTGSMDGMYIVPLGIPIEQRTDAGCLHKITLAPPGVSATDIFDLVIDDIVVGMTDGVDVYVEGEKCRLFLDMICYIGDSPALACVTGCKGDSSDTPCHVCGFRRDKRKKVQIVSSNGATSSQSAERRSVRRVLDIRASANGAEDIDKIGIRNVDAAILKLSKKLKEARGIPKTSNGFEVVPKSFDAYISSLISPDHVFLGLIGNILEVLLRLMTPKEREEFDRNCVEILRSNDLYNRRSILNVDRNILKSTISEAFAIIFVRPTVLSCMKLNLSDNNVEEKNTSLSKKTKTLTKKSRREKAFRIVIELIHKLNDIIIQAQSNPDTNIDSKVDLDIFNNRNGRTRLENLVKYSNDYAAVIEHLANEDISLASILDKTNLHRFIELFVHTLPMVGSLKYIEELILEKGHQSAKKAVDMSNQKNGQLQAMNDYLHDDLIARLKSITREYPVLDKDSEIMLQSELKELVGCIDTQDNLIFDLLSTKVVQTIRIIGKDICNRDEHPMWIVEGTQSEYLIEYKETMEKASNNMESLIRKAAERGRW